MTIPTQQQGGPIEARGRIAPPELSDQEQLIRGIEGLIIELMRYHLSPHDLKRFEAGELGELRTQGTESKAPQDYYRQGSKVAKQTGHGSPGVFVRDQLTFEARSWGFSLRATTRYAQGRLTDASLSAFGDGVSTLEDLEEERELLIESCMLPPEPRVTTGESLAPRPSTGVVFQPGMPEPV